MSRSYSMGRLAWLYQARRVLTRATNDGYNLVDVSIATGQVAHLVSAAHINSGTNNILISVFDEDNVLNAVLANVASGAARLCYIPSIGSAATANANVNDSHDWIIAPGQKFTFEADGNGANGDTMTLSLVLLLFNLPTIPTWVVTRSTGTLPTLAASTISAGNTLQQVFV